MAEVSIYNIEQQTTERFELMIPGGYISYYQASLVLFALINLIVGQILSFAMDSRQSLHSSSICLWRHCFSLYRCADSSVGLCELCIRVLLSAYLFVQRERFYHSYGRMCF